MVTIKTTKEGVNYYADESRDDGLKYILKRNPDYFKEVKKEICDSWNFNNFKVTCCKCKSEKVIINIQQPEYSMGSEYTGMWCSEKGGVVVKCIDCGHAMKIEMESDY